MIAFRNRKRPPNSLNDNNIKIIYLYSKHRFSFMTRKKKSQQDSSLVDVRDIMAYPFVSLSTKKRLEPIEFSTGKGDEAVWVKVTANEQFGMATIYDYDIILWIAFYLRCTPAGSVPPRIIHTTPYRILKFLNRGTGKRAYQLLSAALYRLQSTTIQTNIRQGTRKLHHTFSWISEVKEHIDPVTEKVDGLDLVLPDWLYDMITNNKEILAVDRDYLRIQSGLVRALWRIVRRHGGKQPGGYAFTFHELYKKCGVTTPYRNFKIDLKDIIAKQPIKGYLLKYVQRGTEDIIWFANAQAHDLLEKAKASLETAGQANDEFSPTG